MFFTNFNLITCTAMTYKAYTALYLLPIALYALHSQWPTVLFLYHVRCVLILDICYLFLVSGVLYPQIFARLLHIM